MPVIFQVRLNIFIKKLTKNLPIRSLCDIIYDRLLVEGRGMTRQDFEAMVFDLYGVKADYPFEDDFTTGVFRHEGNKK